MGFWDNFSNGDRFKFVTPGDSIEGDVVRLSATDFGGTADMTPVITIRTPQGDKEVTASQRVLIGRLAEQSPEVGDWISVRYDGEAESARPGRSPAKLFTVTVKRGKKAPDGPQRPVEDDDEPF